jgi:hypothetical protein
MFSLQMWLQGVRLNCVNAIADKEMRHIFAVS